MKATKANAAPSEVRGDRTQIQFKDSKYLSQAQRIYDFFYSTTTTMYDAEKQTGICRPSICRYIGKMRKSDRVAIVKKGICPISKHRAGFITTNPKRFPSDHFQPTLFDQV